MFHGNKVMQDVYYISLWMQKKDIAFILLVMVNINQIKNSLFYITLDHDNVFIFVQFIKNYHIKWTIIKWVKTGLNKF